MDPRHWVMANKETWKDMKIVGSSTGCQQLLDKRNLHAKVIVREKPLV